MRGTSTPQLRTARRGGYRPGWHNLGWKLLLAFLLLLVMVVDLQASGSLFLALMALILVIWGGLFVAVSGVNLFGGPLSRRLAWVALAVGAYSTLALAGTFKGAAVLSDALGPVAALTLVPHLGRRDLTEALRDWLVVMALALYAAIGIISMWLLITTLRLPVFFIAVLFPPVVFEAALLLFARLRAQPRVANTLAVLLSTLFGMSVFSVTQFNRATPLEWSLLFSLIVGLLIGGAMLIGLLTRPLVEAACGGGASATNRLVLRSFIELSYGAILIAIALYIPLRLLGMGG
jgi:hypothetical protein